MLSLILSIVLGLGIAYFAFQNSLGVSVNLASYHLSNIPLYFVVLAAVLAGIVMAWFISAVNGMSHLMRIRSKDTVIQKDRKEIEHMKTKIHDLELENAKLKGEHSKAAVEHHVVAEESVNEHKVKTPFFNRFIRPRSANNPQQEA